ncbi:MAG: hypothetical protein ACT4P6_04145 [Gemmatimonadaceae bacterium]
MPAVADLACAQLCLRGCPRLSTVLALRTREREGDRIALPQSLGLESEDGGHTKGCGYPESDDGGYPVEERDVLAAGAGYPADERTA